MKQVSFTYPDATKPVLENIDLSIKEGEFVVICGLSGCGKSTLLKMFKRELTPHGERSGEILYRGIPLGELEPHVSCGEIGYVLQSPEQQIVTDKVWNELTFGMENLGYSRELMRLRAGETASYFGIQNLFRRDTATLSGGQKQLLNLASVMAMSPRVLLLDEPTSQLDPIAAGEFITTLKKLNQELGLTVVLIEHRLEEVMPLADRVLVMRQGHAVVFDTPQNVCQKMKNDTMCMAFPASVRMFHALDGEGNCPMTVCDGRIFLERNYTIKNSARVPFAMKKRFSSYAGAKKDVQLPKDTVLSLENVWFRYEKNGEDILRGVNLGIQKGELFGIVGGNGSGKTTTLAIMAGLKKPYRGTVRLNGKKLSAYRAQQLYRRMLAVLPQNPQTVFVHNTVRADLEEMCHALQDTKERTAQKLEEIAEKIKIKHLFDKHPYDLSGGEQQLCAIAKVMLSEPEILLLDEPTKGIDAGGKQVLSDILQQLRAEGVTMVMVTHDIEFAAENAKRCGLFFDGEILAAGETTEFFGGNHFYTTAACRMAGNLFENVVTTGQLIQKCKEQENGDE